MVEPRGIAPRSTQCHCVVLLLDDGPEMDAHPGLAPGNSVLQTDGSTTLPCARFLSGVTAGICTDLASLPTMSVALYALAELLKWSGTSVLPRVFAAPAAMQMALRVS